MEKNLRQIHEKKGGGEILEFVACCLLTKKSCKEEVYA
jgi:hypothetical protein